MNNASLYVNNISVPIMKELAVQISYLIADVRYPDKRNSSFTKTIQLPSTKIIDRIFEFCFEVNISLQSFNPNIKTPVSYRINNTEVLAGNLQLTKMLLNKKAGSVIYECKIFGHFSDLFYDIGEAYLTGNDDSSLDLDFSAYDHIINYQNVINTWSPAVTPNTNVVNSVDTAIVAGIGYRYPLIDYGFNGGSLTDHYAHHLRPGLFAYEYLVKMFQRVGKTFESAFLNGAFFKTLMIPCVDSIKVPLADQEDRTCNVGVVSPLLANPSVPLFYQGPGGGDEWDSGTGGLASQTYPILDNDSTLPYNDAGNIYNLANGEITIPFRSEYTISVDLPVSFNLNWSGGGISTLDNVDLYLKTSIEMWDGVSWAIVAGTDPYIHAGAYPSSNLIDGMRQQCSVTGLYTAGTKFRLRIDHLVDNAYVRDGVGAVIITGTMDYFITIDSTFYPIVDTFFKCELLSQEVFDGDTIEMNRAIPSRIKQKDFLKGIINMFNLYLDVDKDNPNNYIIEPREDFFNNDIEDWTDKEDITVNTEIIPASQIGFKRVNFNYKSDSDYYNKSYQDAYGRTYGYNIFQSENEFTNDEANIDVVFSPTPLVGNAVNRLIIPKIYKNEDGTVTPQKGNIRILQYAGYINQNPAAIYWRLINAGVTEVQWDGYPYAGHLDNPYAPTFDLNFGVPYEVYYTGYPLTYTDNNAFIVYHYPMYNQLDNKDCKVVVSRFVLNELDIKKFDFRKKYIADGSIYRVNAINNFDLTNEASTQVELLKIV